MYYIIGYENGQIKIWRIGKKTELLIHTFDGHVKQVTELIEHRDKRLYWSSSPDMTLRLWNMEVLNIKYSNSVISIQLL